jgi:serine O-acetyltransferase
MGRFLEDWIVDEIRNVADELMSQREQSDPLTEASKEVLPYQRRVGDALGALRAIVTDDTPSAQLTSDLRVIQGLVAALVGSDAATQLIQMLPSIRRDIAKDLAAAFHGDPSASSYGEIIAAYPSVVAVSTYRIAHGFHGLGEKIVARIMSRDAHSRTGIDIHPGATIGDHFFIDHGTGVVIGETCKLGNRVKLYHGVTLGAFSNKVGRSDVGTKRHPTLEDDVTVYPNASILGGDTVIGAGSVIGGNVWLTQSVPPHTRVTIDAPSLQCYQKAPTHRADGI